MNLKEFAREIIKEAGITGVASKAATYASSVKPSVGLAKKTISPSKSLSRKLNTTTPYGMV